MKDALISLVPLAVTQTQNDNVIGYLVLGAILLGILALIVINILKGKYWTALGTVFLFGLIGIICSIVGSVRVAKPGSWWAKRFYDEERKQEALYHHDAAKAARGAKSQSAYECPLCGVILDDEQAAASHMQSQHGRSLPPSSQGDDTDVGEPAVPSSGEPMPTAASSKFCAQCGEQTRPNAAFCAHCGFDLK